MAELKTFLFTDICGSVRLKGEMIGRSGTERDQAFIEVILTPHRGRIEDRLEELGGRVVSTAGDGHFLVFENTVQAAEWAVAVQRSHRDEPIKTPAGDAVEVRISMHVGVPQLDPRDPNNFVGKTVDYAARLNDYATGAQILVSRSVMAILDDVGLEGIRLHLHGKKGLKGIGSVEVHELLYDDHGPRQLRSAPKSHGERQWTVLPTVGFDGSGGGADGGSGIAVAPQLKRVGNYELEELLGAGGMGDVYKARHTQFGRIRAVKVIKPQFVAGGHGEMIRRFYTEIKAVGRLEHKNIVVAIDSSALTDKVHYLVMEFIDGVGVDQLVAQHGAVPVPEACEIIRQAARGLQYIHKNDMVHRDVKPSNLMVTVVDADHAAADSTVTQSGDGERAVVKILDLGLALLAEDGHDRLTRLDHKAMGTGMYMSPEQWRTTSVDIRADIYSLGCTLYHLLAGNPPFHDSDLRPEKAHEKSAVPLIRVHGQQLPKKLWDVLRKMLEKRPDDRYATPAEVSAALAPFCEGHQLAALVRGYHADETHHRGLSATQADDSARADTWRSKSKASGAALLATARSASGTWFKALLGAAAICGAFWLFYVSKQRRIEQARDSATLNLAAMARNAAGEKGDLAEEIARRFKLLRDGAADPALIAALAARNLAPDDAQLLEPKGTLDAWIGEFDHTTDLVVDSWFIVDLAGMQVAHSPRIMEDDTVGQSFRKRDYFHGGGRDLSEAAEIAGAKPIDRPHLSAVYMSSSTKKLKVAFSVPIWGVAPKSKETAATPPAAAAPQERAGATEQHIPIGVLGMSVNVADFEVLDADLQGGKEVVLIDLRADHEQKFGLILNHPKQKAGELQRIDGKLLAAIQAAKPTDEKFRSEDHFQVGYRDPFSPDDPYWGAFQPVAIRLPASRGANQADDADQAGQAGDSERPLWIVLVQEKMPE